MKILFVYQKLYRENENPFARVLVENLQKIGIDVSWGLEKFWEDYQEYDLIHFQWPEKIFGGNKKIDLIKIEQHLDLIRSKGIKLVITCHNLEPHSGNLQLTELYRLLYMKCDAIHHLGEYSYEYLKERTSKNIYHFIVDHHTYYDLNDYTITKKEAREILHLDQETKIILCFGAFRKKEEREMVINAFNKLNIPHKVLLAPSFFKDKTWFTFFYHKMNTFWRKKYKDLHFSRGFINHSDLPYYLLASDVLLIQRKKILNSGNLPLGFSFGKVVVGPDDGNVGAILKKTNNPLFDPLDPESITDALEKGLLLVDDKLIESRAYAYNYMAQEKVAQRLVEEYHKILKR